MRAGFRVATLTWHCTSPPGLSAAGGVARPEMRLHGQSTLLRPEQPTPWLPCPGGRESLCSLPEYLPTARVGPVWALPPPCAPLEPAFLAACWQCSSRGLRDMPSVTVGEPVLRGSGPLPRSHRARHTGGGRVGAGGVTAAAAAVRPAAVGTWLSEGLAELSLKQRGVRESSARGSGMGSGVGGGSRSQEKAVLGI